MQIKADKECSCSSWMWVTLRNEGGWTASYYNHILVLCRCCFFHLLFFSPNIWPNFIEFVWQNVSPVSAIRHLPPIPKFRSVANISSKLVTKQGPGGPWLVSYWMLLAIFVNMMMVPAPNWRPLVFSSCQGRPLKTFAVWGTGGGYIINQLAGAWQGLIINSHRRRGCFPVSSFVRSRVRGKTTLRTLIRVHVSIWKLKLWCEIFVWAKNK